MQNNQRDSLYPALAKAILLAAGIIVILWFLYLVTSAVLLLLFAIVLAIILNRPVSWLEKKGWKRAWASIIVFGSIVIALTGLFLFIGPKLSAQASDMFTNLPDYAGNLSNTVASWFTDYPSIQKKLRFDDNDFSSWVPSVPKTLLKVGNFTFSLLGKIVILIIFLSMVVYAVTNPRPLAELYLSVFPPRERSKATIAILKISTMLSGWIRANLIGGAIEAVLVTIFLSIMNVPGAWVWGALALFAELIPKIGFYIMSIPPILVALSVSPMTALWTLVFFLTLNEIMGDFVMPRLRSSTMNIHPVSTLFLVLALGAAFGLIGALLATPLAAIFKAFYESFYLSRFEEDRQMDKRIEQIVHAD